MTRALLLLVLACTGCAPFASQQYRVGPITVYVQDEDSVDTACRQALQRYVAGAIRGCYFTVGERGYIYSVRDVDTVLHEFKHVFEGDFHP